MGRYDGYFDNLKNEMNRVYNVARTARKKGIDPVNDVEIPIAENMAQRVEGLISVVAPQIRGTGVSYRIQELEKEYNKLDWRVALQIALEVAQQKFCKFKDEKEAMEIGIRTGFAYATSGVVSSPLEGFVELKFFKRKDNQKEYFCLFYSGPIRSAGGTGASVSVLIADYVRKSFGYDKYDPTEDEIRRSYIECLDYHEKVTNLQYFPSEEEITFMCKNLPVQISGDPSEKYEVSNYKDLDRVGTNRIRNGFCLVIAECLCQKAPKVYDKLSKWGNDFGMQDWNFLGDFIELQKKIKSKSKQATDDGVKIRKDYTFIKDIVAGRPVVSQPSASGGFRVRYGKSRFSGFAALSIHPCTMYLLNDYIAVGTQLKYERPGKSTAITPVTDINGPIIKLDNGDVVYVETVEQSKELRGKCKEILYLGDILINYGEFLNRAHILVPVGYCEEWWIKELLKAADGIENISIKSGLHKDLINKLVSKPINTKIELMDVLKLSNIFKIPLHPRYIFYWNEIKNKDLLNLLKWIERSSVKREDSKIILPLVTEDDYTSKRALELIGVPHKCLFNENVSIDGEWAEALMVNLGFFDKELSYNESIFSNYEDKSLTTVNKLSNAMIKDKSGTFVGARMGRPEKAKLRKLTGSPHMLFPVGTEGDRLRSLQESINRKQVTGEFSIYFCNNCNKETIYPLCEKCDKPTEKKFYCKKCDKVIESNICNITDRSGVNHGECFAFKSMKIDIDYYFKCAIRKLNMKNTPALIKGVRGTSNKEHIPENLIKGILRATYDLYVNKDGTIRYDMTEMPMTHFKPKEIGTSIKKLKELGYTNDIFENDLVNDDQLLELMPQDIVLPSCPESGDEGADTVFLRVANYIDDMLERVYDLPRFYNLKSKDDLIGHVVMGLAPHTSAGILGRIIGFIKAQAVFANFMWHAAQRRDCFSYDTNIPIYDGNSWSNVKIGEFVENLKPNKIVDSFGTFAKDVNIYQTLAYNIDTKKIDTMPIKWFTKHTPTELLEIKLENGRKLKVTPNHKFYVYGKNIQEKKACSLKVGNQLIVPYNFDININKIDFIDCEGYFKESDITMVKHVRDYVQKRIKETGSKKFYKLFEIKQENLKNYIHRDSFPIKLIDRLLKYFGNDWEDLPKVRKLSIKRSFVEFPAKIKVDKDLLIIIGFYIAEGFSRCNKGNKSFYQVDFAIHEDRLRNYVKNLIFNKFGLNPVGVGGQKRLTYSSRLFYELFTNILKVGDRAHGKRIPNIFLNLPKEKLAYLLSAYFEGDGSVSLTDLRVSCDTVSIGLINDLEFAFSRFGIYLRKYESDRLPGKTLRQFYLRKRKKVPKFKSTKIIIPSNFCYRFYNYINFISREKRGILREVLRNIKPKGMKIEHDNEYAYLKIVGLTELSEETTYCLNVPGHHNVIANGIIAKQCDGDETCCMLLLDTLINFSRHYLPAHRGSTQDAPLVLTSKLIPSEVDEQILDVDTAWTYPLELYEAASEYKQPWQVKIERMADKLNTESEYYNMGFTHNVGDINDSVRISAYKYLETMMDKVRGQMDLAERIRAVNEDEVAKLLIERHFIRDIKGNLRQFSMQQFRCVKCNEKYRRPPLIGVCLKCGNRILFTVSEGTIVKYLEPSLELASKYNLSNYLKQTLEITKMRIESTFGKDKERQEGLVKWFNTQLN